MGFGNAFGAFVKGGMQGASFMQGMQANSEAIEGRSLDNDRKAMDNKKVQSDQDALKELQDRLGKGSSALYGVRSDGSVDPSYQVSYAPADTDTRTNAAASSSDRFGNAGFGLFRK